MRRRLSLIALLCLTGCGGGISYAMQNYGGITPVRFEYGEEARATTGGSAGITTGAPHFRIFDKPGENRLMITPSLGAAAGQGFVTGLTFGIARPRTAEVIFRDVAVAYLASTGRHCEALSTDLIIEPQYEVKYRCDSTMPGEQMGADGQAPTAQ